MTKPESPVFEFRRVNSRQNATIKALRGALTQGELTVDGCCAVEGLKSVQEALRSMLKFQSVIISEAAIDRAQGILQALGGTVEILLVPHEVFASAVDTESPQGVAALVFPPKHALTELLADKDSLLVVLVGIQDPGNLGTIIRSAEAFGAGGVILGEGTVGRFNAKAIRASAGSLFRLPCVTSKLQATVRELRGAGFRLVGTSSHKGIAPDRTNFKGGVALVIGSEGAGLSAELLAEMDELVTIPHHSSVESLNAGVAASVLLYEAARQRLNSFS